MSAERQLAALEAALRSSGGVGDWLAVTRQLRETLTLSPDDVARLVLGYAPPALRAEFQEAISKAFQAGADDARLATNAPDSTARGSAARPSFALLASVAAADREAAAAIAKAKTLARAGMAAEIVAASILGNARKVAALTSDTITRAGAEGVVAVAEETGVALLWVAETNACVHCLALSGTIARPGGAFSSSATYGARPLPTFDGPVVSPPRHPNCRCTLEPAVSLEFAAALRREADRSVLRGFSLESESMRVRVDAAERLLAKGVDAPKSVRAFARGAVRRGEFPTRGRPAGGSPTPGTGPGFPPNRPPTPPRGPTAPPTRPPAGPTAPPTPPRAAPPTAPTRPASPELARLRARAAELEGKSGLYVGLPGRVASPRLVKLRKAHEADLATARGHVAVEELNGKTPSLDALPKRKPSPIASVVADANPGRASRLYDNNCTNAVVAAEMRTRGFDVVAAPRAGRVGRVSAESAEGWRDVDGKLRPFTEGLDERGLAAIVDQWPDGARGFVAGHFRATGGGHIFTVEKINGKAAYHEPQVPESAVGGGAVHLGRLQGGGIRVLRVDDLTPTDTLAGYVVPDTTKIRAGLSVTGDKAAAIMSEMTGIKSKIDELDKANRVLARTDAEKTAYFARIVERNALANEYNALLRKRKRL